TYGWYVKEQPLIIRAQKASSVAPWETIATFSKELIRSHLKMHYIRPFTARVVLWEDAKPSVKHVARLVSYLSRERYPLKICKIGSNDSALNCAAEALMNLRMFTRKYRKSFTITGKQLKLLTL